MGVGFDFDYDFEVDLFLSLTLTLTSALILIPTHYDFELTQLDPEVTHFDSESTRIDSREINWIRGFDLRQDHFDSMQHQFGFEEMNIPIWGLRELRQIGVGLKMNLRGSSFPELNLEWTQFGLNRTLLETDPTQIASETRQIHWSQIKLSHPLVLKYLCRNRRCPLQQSGAKHQELLRDVGYKVQGDRK